MIWDEQERFARAVVRAIGWALVALGVALAVASLATGIPEFFLVFLRFLGILGAILLGYSLVVGGVTTALIGLARGLGRFIRRFSR